MNSTEELAEVAKSIVTPSNYDDDTGTYAVPNGWQFAGMGAYRVCLVGPDGNVYKVMHDSDNDWQENTMEWEGYSLWSSRVMELSNNVIRLAKPVEFYTDSNVLVMEYEPCAANVMWMGFGWEDFYCSNEVREMLNLIQAETDITDLHSGNVYFNTQGEVVIVDYTH